MSDDSRRDNFRVGLSVITGFAFAVVGQAADWSSDVAVPVGLALAGAVWLASRYRYR